MPAPAESPDAGTDAQTGDDANPSASAGTTPEDGATVDAAAEAPADDAAVQSGVVEAPLLDAGPPPAEAVASVETDSIATGLDAGPAANSSDPAISPAAQASGGAALSPNLPSPSIQLRKDGLLAAQRVIGASDIGTAAEPPRSSVKPSDAVGAQFASGQTAFAPNPASFFTALPPEQPSMQAWLDHWLGPRARAAGGSQENAPGPTSEDVELPSAQDLPPLNLPEDLPEARPEPTLTAEEIAQGYQDIAIWLDAHPGIEQGGPNGAPPEKNLFAILAPGSAGDDGLASMACFGQSPGMAAIGGEALQPLRGIQEGYAALRVV